MQVIKRDGRLQEFDMKKIETSILRASDDIEEPMTESDAHMIARDIEKVVRDKYDGKIEATLIHMLVLGELIEDGFGHVAKEYDQAFEEKED